MFSFLSLLYTSINNTGASQRNFINARNIIVNYKRKSKMSSKTPHILSNFSYDNNETKIFHIFFFFTCHHFKSLLSHLLCGKTIQWQLNYKIPALIVVVYIVVPEIHSVLKRRTGTRLHPVGNISLNTDLLKFPTDPYLVNSLLPNIWIWLLLSTWWFLH